ncbi:hypothetical protein D1BOALGB6SA_6992 [Olavius sp. associated proteobacterium Delta 1]|nr:hypothetical protein D1BOALGB6SA_6992 [Olavius sp. associated proteobacterium Delta 1]
MRCIGKDANAISLNQVLNFKRHLTDNNISIALFRLIFFMCESLIHEKEIKKVKICAA